MTVELLTPDVAPGGTVVSDDEFAALMEPLGSFEPGQKIAIGVSGGPDSMALICLAAAWARQACARVVGLTVDHDLRAESSAEAEQVAKWLAEMGVQHQTLLWREGKAVGQLDRSPQAAARQARFDLMTEWCKSEGIGLLLLAHHADDQMETFFQRLVRGSGLDGLAAMQQRSERNGVCIGRPFLGRRKADLIATCEARGQNWTNDPSNNDDRYTRVRLRKLLGDLDREGLGPERMLQTIEHLQRAKAAIDAAVEEFEESCVSRQESGSVSVDLSALVAAPEEVALRALSRLLKDVSGSDYPPRFDSLKAVFEALDAERWSDRTLHGCQLRRQDGSLMIIKEPKNRQNS